QVIKFPAQIIRPEYIQEIIHIKIPVFYPILLKYHYIIIPKEFIKTIETRKHCRILLKMPVVSGNGIGKRYILTAFKGFIILFPKGKQQCFDTFFLFRVQMVTFPNNEGIVTDWVFFTVGDVVAVYHITQAFIAMSHIHQYDMRSLLVIAAYHMIGKKGFSAPRGTQYKFVTVGTNSHFHRFITDVHMHGFARHPISQTNPDRT